MSEAVESSRLSRPDASRLPAIAWRLLAALAGAKLLVHLLTNGSYGIFIDEKGQVSVRRDAASDDDDDDEDSDDEFDDLEDDWLPLLCQLSGEQQEVAQRLAHAMPYLRQGRYKRFLWGRLGVPRSERWRLLLVCWWAGTRGLPDTVAEARHYQGPRCPFSLQQLRGLSDLYARNANPSIAVRRVAGARLGLTANRQQLRQRIRRPG